VSGLHLDVLPPFEGCMPDAIERAVEPEIRVEDGVARPRPRARDRARAHEGTGERESDVFFVPREKHVEHQLGAVEAGDVQKLDLTMHVKETWTEQTFTLAYNVSVSRQGRAFEFVVDAATGEVLEQPRQWPAGKDGVV
jgi:hypothetical protein